MIYFSQSITDLFDLLLFEIPFMLIILFLRRRNSLPEYIYRKIVHFALVLGIFYLMSYAHSWQSALIQCIVIIIFWYPIFLIFEKYEFYKNVLAEKNPGEIKRTLLLLFVPLILETALAGFLFNDTINQAVSVIMWGFGDAAAAIIGTNCGFHKIGFGVNRNNKSFEGTLAMFTLSLIFAIVTTRLYSYPFTITSLLFCSIISAIVELLTDGEYDTFTVPTSNFLFLSIYRLI